MSNNVITIRKETAKAFFPAGGQWSGEVDVDVLAKLANAAMAGSARSLAAAGDIADSNAISRWWNSGDMQKHMIQAISHLGEMSAVNLGLSAICTDLAAANLEHASRIDKNHHATNQQLNQVQQLTAELLAHLRKPREPALLDRLLPALSKANPADQDAMRGWLRTLTEEIDLQYAVLQENLDKLALQNDFAVESVNRFRAEIASFSEALVNQKADALQQCGLLSSRLTASVADLGQKTENTAIAIRQTREALFADIENQVKLLRTQFQLGITQAEDKILSAEAAARVSSSELDKKISGLTRELTKRHSEMANALNSEKEARESTQKALVKFIKDREGVIRTTIGELNQHLLKRMLWGAGGIVVLQIIGFGFLALKMGLFK